MVNRQVRAQYLTKCCQSAQEEVAWSINCLAEPKRLVFLHIFLFLATHGHDKELMSDRLSLLTASSPYSLELTCCQAIHGRLARQSDSSLTWPHFCRPQSLLLGRLLWPANGHKREYVLKPCIMHRLLAAVTSFGLNQANRAVAAVVVSVIETMATALMNKHRL